MRMWLIDPKLMCNQHLLGCHGELHKHLHNWQKKHSVTGRIEGNAMEPLSYKARHDLLAEEMLARGMNHKSPLEQPDFSYLPAEQREYKVNVRLNELLIMERCEECKRRLTLAGKGVGI